MWSTSWESSAPRGTADRTARSLFLYCCMYYLPQTECGWRVLVNRGPGETSRVRDDLCTNRSVDVPDEREVERFRQAAPLVPRCVYALQNTYVYRVFILFPPAARGMKNMVGGDPTAWPVFRHERCDDVMAVQKKGAWCGTRKRLVFTLFPPAARGKIGSGGNPTTPRCTQTTQKYVCRGLFVVSSRQRVWLRRVMSIKACRVRLSALRHLPALAACAGMPRFFLAGTQSRVFNTTPFPF